MLSIQSPEVAAMKRIFRDAEDFLRLFVVVPLLSPFSFLVLAAEGVEGKTNEAANQKEFLPSTPLPRQSTPHFPFNRALWTALSLIFLFFSPPFVSDVPSEQSVFVMLNGEESELRFLNISNPKVSLLNPFFFSYILDRRIAQSIRITKFIFKCVKGIIVST